MVSRRVPNPFTNLEHTDTQGGQVKRPKQAKCCPDRDSVQVRDKARQSTWTGWRGDWWWWWSGTMINGVAILLGNRPTTRPGQSTLGFPQTTQAIIIPAPLARLCWLLERLFISKPPKQGRSLPKNYLARIKVHNLWQAKTEQNVGPWNTLDAWHTHIAPGLSQK